MELLKGNGPPKDDASMQVPLQCPGTTEKPLCTSNVYEQLPVVIYTRHRLQSADRKFDQVYAVGNRYRCVGCGHVLAKEDFNRPF